MEGWAHYRHYRHGGIGKTLLQRAMDGMPGTHCPTCAGRGRAPGSLINHKAQWISCPTCGGSGRAKLHINHRTVHRQKCPLCKKGEILGRSCFRCRGSGEITVVRDKANPAFINSTYREPDHPIYQRIDRLVCELRRRHALLGYWFVIREEYLRQNSGLQQMRAERLGITHESYRKRLQRAHEWIDAALADPRDCRLIPFPYQPANLLTSCHKTV
jgi:hypothetical protein